MALIRGAPQDLSGLRVFEGLSEAELADLSGALRRTHLRQGANLIGVEQPGEVVYVIASGTLRVQVEGEDGSLVILGFLGTGDVVGEMSVLDLAVRSASVVATEDCTVLWLDRPTFLVSLERMPRLALNLLRSLAHRLRSANDRILALATLDVAGRVATELSALAASHGEIGADGSTRIALRLTQGDLADLVGASRERVNRAVVDLRRRGIIDLEAQYRFVVRDTAALDRWGR
jgi:CRP/FNR family cyclic AMP-dependent transcriptional regulator